MQLLYDFLIDLYIRFECWNLKRTYKKVIKLSSSQYELLKAYNEICKTGDILKEKYNDRKSSLSSYEQNIYVRLFKNTTTIKEMLMNRIVELQNGEDA